MKHVKCLYVRLKRMKKVYCFMRRLRLKTSTCFRFNFALVFSGFSLFVVKNLTMSCTYPQGLLKDVNNLKIYIGKLY